MQPVNYTCVTAFPSAVNPIDEQYVFETDLQRKRMPRQTAHVRAFHLSSPSCAATLAPTTPGFSAEWNILY